MARGATTSDMETQHYEVRCPSCNVSFAVGTRRCVHCGGRTAAAGMGPSPSLRQDLGKYRMDSAPEPDPMVLEPALEEADETRSSSPFRLGMSGIWIMLAIVGSMYRVCFGG